MLVALDVPPNVTLVQAVMSLGLIRQGPSRGYPGPQLSTPRDGVL